MPRHRLVAAAWKPFLTGVGIGLALLFAAGTSLAQGIDHAPFDALLRANVKNGVVNYSGFQNNATFKQYVESLSKPAKLETKADQITYYSNAYNAFAIQSILDGLSPSSFFGRARYFKTKEWPLNGRNITLYSAAKLDGQLDEQAPRVRCRSTSPSTSPIRTLPRVSPPGRT